MATAKPSTTDNASTKAKSPAQRRRLSDGKLSTEILRQQALLIQRGTKGPETERPGLLRERMAHVDLLLSKYRGVRRRYLRVRLDSIPTNFPRGYHAAAARLLVLKERPTTLAIGGPRGVGKTALASGLVRAFTEGDRSALLLTARELAESIDKAPWIDREKAKERYRRVECLIIDEIQEITETWLKSHITAVVDARYADEKATVMLTNLLPDAFFEHVGDSVMRRVQEEGKFIEANWDPINSLKAFSEEEPA